MADPFFSEIQYRGAADRDFIEVAVDAGADVSTLVVTIYHANGSVRSTNPLSGLTATTMNGKDVYVVDTVNSGSFTGLSAQGGLALSDSTTVFGFLAFTDRTNPLTANFGPAAGMTATPIGTAPSNTSLETNDGGASYFLQTSTNPGAVPCLTNGTFIRTPDGQVPVEDLAAGDLVVNAEGNCVRLVFSLCRTLSLKDFAANPKLYPVRICKGALGSDLPERDLLVSRQHRMLVSSPIAARIFGTSQVLVAAIKLINLPGIFIDKSVQALTYFHLLFDKHEVLFAEGAPTESLFLGEEAIKALPQDTISEIATLFPNFRRMHVDMMKGPVIAKGQKQIRLIERHALNHKPLIACPV